MEFITKILANWGNNTYIRLFGINVPISIQNCISKFNNKYLKTKMDRHEFLMKDLSLGKIDDINEEKELIRKYFNKYLKLSNDKQCNCN